MSSTEMSGGIAADARPGTVPMRFEVTVLPVADVDRAKAFYTQLGWRLDADFPIDDHARVVQMTPPGSPASIIFGDDLTTMTPGSVKDLMLIVDDIDEARDDLVARGIDVSAVWHDETGVFHHAGIEGRVEGHDPERGSYKSWVSFSDPDGNGWNIQEITERLPGRLTNDVDELAQLLEETSIRHGAFEAVTPPHDWWDWYAAYMHARQGGSSPDDSSAAADRYMAEAKSIARADGR